MYKVTMLTDGTVGATSKINYNGTLDTSANVPDGSYNIVATVPSGYNFTRWNIIAGSGRIASPFSNTTILGVLRSNVTVIATYNISCYVDPTLCPTLPIFSPVACGIPQTLVFPNPTSRAARKANKSASIFSGQAQSTRIGALKKCIAQVNASEIGFNQVNRQNITVCDTITYQESVTRYEDIPQVPPKFNDAYSKQLQPNLNITTVDPSGNIYSLTNYILGGQNILTATRFTTSNESVIPDIVGDGLVLPNTLVSANLFWRNDFLVFVGIFYGITTYIQIYTYNAALKATLVPLQYPIISNTKRYTGQSTYNLAGYIYITLAAPPSGGFESAPLYYVSPDLTVITDTNIQDNYNSIQQTIGDTDRGAIITAAITNDMYLIYIFNSATIWRELLFSGQSPLCAVSIYKADTEILGLTLGYNGTDVVSTYFSYVPTTASYSLISTTTVAMTWPNSIPYRVQAITLCTAQSRFFYTMKLYNPTITNFQYYIQTGEISLNGTIVGAPINIQIGEGYNIAPTNTIQAGTNYLAVASGLNLTTYAITIKKNYQALITLTRERKYCITEIVYPGCGCPVLPVNNNPPLEGLTRTLNLAICQPIQFSNPGLSDGCGPVYTAPTKYLSDLSGAEPPQGPAVKTIIRKYDRINGIDEICKPIPGRYGSSRTARIRSNIEAAGATRYSTTVLPLVQYPFPCPVYGNQTGIPRASLCQPSIDARPTNGVPS